MKGMRRRGHELVLAIQKGGRLAERARAEGFIVYELDLRKKALPGAIIRLLRIMRRHRIELVNTHSSSDAWLGGIAGRIYGAKVVRTRHLSTSIRSGLNSRILYGKLADFVATTSSVICPVITTQARILPEKCRCIPTGVEPCEVVAKPEEVAAFRQSLNLKDGDFLIGTACVVRSWKGIEEFLRAAQLLKSHPHLKWVIVGGGYLDKYRPIAAELGLEGTVFFTGHLERPFSAMAAFDLFVLLSTAHEGISQAILQAAYLKKPLLATSVGGLPEVCLDGKTGFVVPPKSAEAVADAVLKLSSDQHLCRKMGERAHELVIEKFTFDHTLNEMESVYTSF